jgi:hypothetical protein
VGCPIRRSRDQRSLASPPGFSQRATSFIASQCQGIHQMPLFCSIQDYRSGRRRPPQHPGQPPRTGASPILAGPPFWQGPLTKVSLCQGFPAGAASSMKTLLGRPACELTPAPRRRPPRSHSQIRFTRSINTAPDTRSPARDTSRPVDPTPEQTWSSPNVVHQGSDDQISVIRTGQARAVPLSFR